MAANTVLLVEDNPSDVFIVQRTFQKLQLPGSLQVAADGDEAVAYLSGSGRYADRERYPLPALVLLDLKLPRRSGFEVLEWLKAQPILGRVPVVVFTSSRQPSDINRAYDHGANSYLVKTVNPRDSEDLGRILCHYWVKCNQQPDLDPLAS
ncbi:MAG TPA: response regulator [Candidatus Angelobacter sp.]|nr:response regulator [Candidatus Angelobacter sp.]